jgi:predicted GIY-YIG superfamily endonuclease
MFNILENTHTDFEKVINRCVGNTASSMLVSAIQSHIRQEKWASTHPTLDERNREDEHNHRFQDESVNADTGEILSPAIDQEDWRATQLGYAPPIKPLILAGLFTSIRKEYIAKQLNILVNPDQDRSIDGQYKIIELENLIDFQINTPRETDEAVISLKATVLSKGAATNSYMKLLKTAAAKQAIRNCAELKEIKLEILEHAKHLTDSHTAENAFAALPIRSKYQFCSGVMNRLARHQNTLTNRFLRASRPHAMLALATEMEFTEATYKQLEKWLNAFSVKNASALEDTNPPLELAA